MDRIDERWGEIRQSMERLSSMDKSNLVFGAGYHQYRIPPVVDSEVVTFFEEKLGLSLPKSVASFYLYFGNGGASPYYGVEAIEDLVGYSPNKEYPGKRYYEELARERGTLNEDGYFEVEEDDLAGLIPLIHEGCGGYVCVVSAGSMVDSVVTVTGNGQIFETGKNFQEFYQEWLEKQFAIFSTIEELLDSDLSMEEIHELLSEQFSCFNGSDLVVSYLGKRRPKKLFGERGHRIYHGATQLPWYEKQLKKWRGSWLRRLWKGK